MVTQTRAQKSDSIVEVKTDVGQPAIDVVNQFVEFWTSSFDQATVQTKNLIEQLQGAKDIEDLHRRWLAGVSQNLESFMRTPMFLELMKQNLKTMTDLKMVQDQMTQSVARHVGIPLSGDITGLFERLNSIEQTVLSRIGRIENSMKAIEAKLGSGQES